MNLKLWFALSILSAMAINVASAATANTGNVTLVPLGPGGSFGTGVIYPDKTGKPSTINVPYPRTWPARTSGLDRAKTNEKSLANLGDSPYSSLRDCTWDMQAGGNKSSKDALEYCKRNFPHLPGISQIDRPKTMAECVRESCTGIIGVGDAMQCQKTFCSELIIGSISQPCAEHYVDLGSPATEAVITCSVPQEAKQIDSTKTVN